MLCCSSRPFFVSSNPLAFFTDKSSDWRIIREQDDIALVGNLDDISAKRFNQHVQPLFLCVSMFLLDHIYFFITTKKCTFYIGKFPNCVYIFLYYISLRKQTLLYSIRVYVNRIYRVYVNMFT